MRTRVVQVRGADRRRRFCLVFPREALSVPVMRRVLGDTLTRLGVDEDCIGDLLLAVTEACTNVLRHGGPTHRYEVVASISRSGCLVKVLDSGRGFNPGRLAAGRRPCRCPRPRALPPPDPARPRIPGSRRSPDHRADGAARRAQPVLPGLARPGREAIARLPESGPRPGHHAGLRRRRHAAVADRAGAPWCRCRSGSRGAADAPLASRPRPDSGTPADPVACRA